MHTQVLSTVVPQLEHLDAVKGAHFVELDRLFGQHVLIGSVGGKLCGLGYLFSRFALAPPPRHASDRFLCASVQQQAHSLQVGPRHTNIGFQGAA